MAAGVLAGIVRGRYTVMTGMSASAVPSAPGAAPVHKGMTCPSWIGRGGSACADGCPVTATASASSTSHRDVFMKVGYYYDLKRMAPASAGDDPGAPVAELRHHRRQPAGVDLGPRPGRGL